MAVPAGQDASIQERREEAAAEHASTVVAGAILAVGGWAGLLWLLLNTLPTVPNRWTFYALLQIALTGTALPVIRLLHRRFSRGGGLYVSWHVMVRQAVWVGLYGTLIAWLRIPRLLTTPLIAGVALALVTVELLLRLRERTQWRPS